MLIDNNDGTWTYKGYVIAQSDFACTAGAYHFYEEGGEPCSFASSPKDACKEIDEMLGDEPI